MQRPSMPSLQSASDLHPSFDDALLEGTTRCAQAAVVMTLEGLQVPAAGGGSAGRRSAGGRPPWHAATTPTTMAKVEVRMGSLYRTEAATLATFERSSRTASGVSQRRSRADAAGFRRLAFSRARARDRARRSARAVLSRGAHEETTMDGTRARKGLNGAVAAGVMIWAATALGACTASPGFQTGNDAGTDDSAAGCGTGSQACGGVCTVVARDPENCGTCGTKCAAGQVCSQGACALSCGGGTTKCGDLCVDTKADSVNCGACGTACTGGQVCSKGACAGTCGVGLAKCGQACVNEQNDRTNCGACGTLCGSGEICNAGKCELSCQVGLIKCAAPVVDGGVSDGGLGTTFCANPQSDPQNCGGCGTACGAGKVCSAGTCNTTCGGNTTTCGSGNGAYCASLQTDNANCGVCGTVCGAGKVCSAGVCSTTCGGNTTTCGSGNNAYCASLQTDNANCGVCGTVCLAGKMCSAGACNTTCALGLTACGSGNSAYCANVQSDNANCGTCGNVCPGNSTCTATVCKALQAGSTYSQAFVINVTPTTQCTAWQTFTGALGSGYGGMVVYSNNSPGFTCTDPTVTNNMAAALKNNTAYTAVCNGHTWSNCNRYSGELWIDPPAQCSGSNCPSPGYIVRPCIGNTNWGGINQATCGGASQTMSVAFF